MHSTWKSFPSSVSQSKVFSRSTRILPTSVGTKVFIYNGRKLLGRLITSSMVGFCYGDYVITRVQAKHKKS